MYHSQLKITYPECPFVWNSTKVNEFYDPGFSETDRDDFLVDIIDITLNKEIFEDKDFKDDILGFISESTHDDTKDDTITNFKFYKCKQTLPKNLRDTHINFHTACYNQEVSKSLNRLYNSDIDWCLVPIVGDVRCSHNPISVIRDSTYRVVSRKLDEDTKDKFSNKILRKRMNARGGIVDIRDSRTDNRNKAALDKRMNARFSRRGFLTHNISLKPPKEEEKHDVFGKIEDKINPENPLMQPKQKQILLTSDTRQQAQEIRQMLMNKCKVSRLKQNPHLVESWKKVDLSLMKVAPTISETNNRSVTNSIKSIPRDCFDYKDDKVGIIKTSGVYRFSPINSGKIKINPSRDQVLHFVTMMRNKDTMHVTLHTINLR